MGDQSHCHVSFWSQANALLRKNLTFQKRNIKTNIWLISFPIILCLLTLVLQRLSDPLSVAVEKRQGVTMNMLSMELSVVRFLTVQNGLHCFKYLLPNIGL